MTFIHVVKGGVRESSRIAASRKKNVNQQSNEDFVEADNIVDQGTGAYLSLIQDLSLKGLIG